jgi:ADP-L-glycero-D-manno-heptose 6-epimerase
MASHVPGRRATGASVRRDEVLVTGAAGFIGGHLARACSQAGWKVTALDIRPPPPAAGGISTVITDRSDAPAVLQDVRAGRYVAVLHQAAITSTLETDWSLLQEVNIRQSLALAEACAAGNAAFIYASSHSVYGTIRRPVAVTEGDEHDPAVCTGPLNLYARSKLDLDIAMTAGGSDAGRAPAPRAGLRYTNVFGPGEQHKGAMASIISQLLRASAEGRPLRLFDDTLEASRDYLPVQCVATAVLAILDHGIPSGVYNLGSGSPVSFSGILGWCTEFAGRAPEVTLVPNPVTDRYQYWTCADITRISRSLPAFTAPGRGDIRTAARWLFRQFQSCRPEEKHAK